MSNCRFRLQRKDPISKPYIIGNRSYPYPTFRWKDIAASDDKSVLVDMLPTLGSRYRVIDTRTETEEVSN